MQPYGAVIEDCRQKIEADAVGFELNGYSNLSTDTPFHHREREFPPGKEGACVAGECSNRRFCKNLQNLFRLHVLNGRAEVQALAVKQEIEGCINRFS